MKKQDLKRRLRETTDINLMQTDMLRGIIRELSDTQEALERRRILYDRLANHSTTQKPKSMNEMADALRKVSISVVSDAVWDEQPPFQELTQAQQDIWMDRLLTILN